MTSNDTGVVTNLVRVKLTSAFSHTGCNAYKTRNKFQGYCFCYLNDFKLGYKSNDTEIECHATHFKIHSV